MVSVLRCIIVLGFALFQLKGIGQGPGCTQLSSPEDGDTDVSVDTTFEWDAADRAEEYVLLVGTTFGGTDILNNVSVGNATEYTLPENLPAGQIIYVAIITLNDAGANGSCEQIQFTTQSSDGLPPCAIPTSPEHAEQGVSTNPILVWQPVENADGYLLTIGTTSGEPPLLDRADVGNVTSFTAPALVQNRTYYFSVVPYNEIGTAENCGVQSSFTTGGIVSDAPTLNCSELLMPINGTEISGTNVRLSWQAVNGADGYRVSVGTDSDIGRFLNRIDVGRTTIYEIPQELPPGIKINVLIVPYENTIEASSCRLFSFSTLPMEVEIPNDLVPTFFTPNNDGVNDRWAVSSQMGFEVANISVFDRYGKLLVQLSPSQEWDGTVNGRNLPSGSYWYAIDIANSLAVVRGYFLLKR